MTQPWPNFIPKRWRSQFTIFKGSRITITIPKRSRFRRIARCVFFCLTACLTCILWRSQRRCRPQVVRWPIFVRLFSMLGLCDFLWQVVFFFNPLEKYVQVKLDHFPWFRGKRITNIFEKHHLALNLMGGSRRYKGNGRFIVYLAKLFMQKKTTQVTGSRPVLSPCGKSFWSLPTKKAFFSFQFHENFEFVHGLFLWFLHFLPIFSFCLFPQNPHRPINPFLRQSAWSPMAKRPAIRRRKSLPMKPFIGWKKQTGHQKETPKGFSELNFRIASYFVHWMSSLSVMSSSVS